jgi:DNA-binding MarR family transcriptional regulator
MGASKPGPEAEAHPGHNKGAVRLAHRNPTSTSLDRLVHERVRLAVLSSLAVTEELCFTDLRKLLQTTDGNLSVHCRRLEEAGYIDCQKQFEGRVPRTTYALTERGRKALDRYLDHMEAIIEATRG